MEQSSQIEKERRKILNLISSPRFFKARVLRVDPSDIGSDEKSFCKKPEESKEVFPLDLPELLAYLVKQSMPLFDHLGIRRDICDKFVESLCSKRKYHLLSHSVSGEDASLIEHHNISDDLNFRIASLLVCHSNRNYWADFANHDIKDEKCHVAIVTTTSLPSMTGTTVNPLF